MAEQSNGFDFDHPAVRELAAEMTGNVTVTHPVELRANTPSVYGYGDVLSYYGGAVEVTQRDPTGKLGSFATVVGLEQVSGVS